MYVVRVDGIAVPDEITNVVLGSRAHVQTSPVGCVRVSFKGEQKAATFSIG